MTATASAKRCLPPTLVAPVLEDPSIVRRLAEADAPHSPVQRYTASAAEAASIGDRNSGAAGALIVAPNFRGDWAYRGEPLVAGVEPLLHHEGFVDAARRMWGAGVVRPQIVFANFTHQLPFPQGGGHIDVPAFRGFDRTTEPVWLLLAMGHSDLFRAEQVTIATAVAWFWTGADGGFEYWPGGVDQPARLHEGDIDNTAFVGDNDNMFHRVRPVGAAADGMVGGLTLDSTLEHLGGDDWAICEAGQELVRLRWDELRISVSWKAYVFADEADAERSRAGEDPLTLGAVVDRFRADLAAKGIDVAAPDDPRHDPDWVQAITDAYVYEPDPLRF